MVVSTDVNPSLTLDSTTGMPAETEKATIVGEGPLSQQTTSSTDIEDQVIPIESDAFGNEEGAEIQYKTCKWWQVNTGILMLAENVSLGVLALPQALAILGLVPGILCICLLGVIATYTGYLIGEFKLAHPSVQSYADCGTLISGPILHEVLAVGQVLVLIFIMGAHILTFGVAMNAITDHGTCTIIFTVIGLVLSFLLGLPRTFKNISYISFFCKMKSGVRNGNAHADEHVACASVILGVTITMVAIGIQKPNMGNIVAVRPDVPLVQGISPVMNIVLAYSGHVAFFSFASELQDPREFRKALFFEQGVAVGFYMLISAVIYYYAGPDIASPALGSASPLISKICFGIALPTIIVAGVVNGSVAIKYVYLRIWKGTDVVHTNSWKSLGSWWAICTVAWLASWILAEAIPNFNLLLGLIGALFGSWFSYALPPLLWLWHNHINDMSFVSKRHTLFTIFHCLLVVLGLAIFGLGMWSSGWALHHGSGGKVFSCENNWHAASWVAE
ncbi:Amino acid transporter transmembrane [Pyrenophora seminiperda CCB06]|uniref:Amino acid transporter transmembrane n=1 Tax=Pyrenophora seminiperda CCB06 TaxID=1302712 RepID=A0A3M7LUQ7_9PLEO|nr:Amino acid transporter transmembrane [Pyrenophora seminiperda CCB06]